MLFKKRLRKNQKENEKKVLTKDAKCSNIFLADAKCKSKKEKKF